MSKRNYVVRCKRGVIEVTVSEYYITKYGEKEAVATAAWNKLATLEQTKSALHDEVMSVYEAQRHKLYEHFRDKITVHWVGVVHG